MEPSRGLQSPPPTMTYIQRWTRIKLASIKVTSWPQGQVALHMWDQILSWMKATTQELWGFLSMIIFKRSAILLINNTKRDGSWPSPRGVLTKAHLCFGLQAQETYSLRINSNFLHCLRRLSIVRHLDGVMIFNTHSRGGIHRRATLTIFFGRDPLMKSNLMIDL